jgi:putative exosortase-associated protein (TIGR04073 family)
MFRLKFLSMIVVVLFSVGYLTLAPSTAAVATAQSEIDEDVYRENTDIERMFHKLGRGIVNVFTGWIEVPKNIAKEWRKTDPFTGTVLGFVKGLGWGFIRTFAGFYEIISFPFPVPRNYEPIMEPEFVLPTVWGERLPIYRDEFIGTGGAIDAAVDYSAPSTTTAGGSSRTY